MEKASEKTAEEPKPKKESKAPSNDVKTSQHASRYFIIGLSLAVFNYLLFMLIANLIFKDVNLYWLSAYVATAFTAILAYILHSKITWKERDPGKTGVYKFIIWNIALTFVISPVLTQLFGYTTALYDLAFNVCNAIHLPLSYEIIQSTGAFVLANAVIMIINFIFYDRFVFGKTKRTTKKL